MRESEEVAKASDQAGRGTSETCALAFEFSNPVLTIARAGAQMVMTWPVFPAASASWQTVSPSGLLIDNLHALTIPLSSNHQFFRLVRP